MIRRLRRNFVLICAASLAAVLLLLCAGINAASFVATAAKADQVIALIHDNGGEIPADSRQGGSKHVSPETPFQSRYCSVTVDAAGDVVAKQDDHIAPKRRADAEAAVEHALSSPASSGYYGAYRFAVYDEADGARTAIVLDSFAEQQTARTVAVITVAASLACLLMVLALLVPLSKRVIRPFERNLARQRQFVTDASHELKTPLAVISANTDLSEAEQGETRWSTSTRMQVERMSGLVSDLIDLARADEQADASRRERFDAGRLVLQAADDFQPLAEASGMHLAAEAEQVLLTADRAQFERVVGILLDNAVKHGDAGGTVRVRLLRRRRNAVLEVENPCAGWNDEQAARVFDRFWRPDGSRDRATGGYGIGLAIARSVVEGHDGRLEVRSKDGAVTFSATFPRAEGGTLNGADR